jgi:hypothetical protein
MLEWALLPTRAETPAPYGAENPVGRHFLLILGLSV